MPALPGKSAHEVKLFTLNRYSDTRLAATYVRYRTVLPDLGLRAARVCLRYFRFDPGMVDGPRGRRARSALVQFQERRGLPVTGELDSETEAHLVVGAFPD